MKPAKIMQKVRRGVQNATYNNPLYQKILSSGEFTGRLHFTMPDPWPGDAQAGLALIADQQSLFDQRSISLRNAGALRNLRAAGTDAARHMAVRLIDNWLRHFDSWHETEWLPDILGERIASWIGIYEFYAPVASPDFLEKLTTSLQRQYKHLSRIAPSSLSGTAALQAIRGLVYGGLNFPDGDRALGLALDLLKRQLITEILPDGGHISRSPSAQLHVLRHLVDLRALFKAAGIEAPENLKMVISSMVPVLKFYRHGDGGLALFHGSSEETPLLIDAVITQAEARGRALRHLPATQYERLTAGRSLLLADCGAPPPQGHDKTGHAGMLAFEFGHGRERIIVNCGAMENASADWRWATAATAAHSTLVIEDTNACEVLSTGLVCPAHVEVQRYEQDDMQGLELVQDSYRPMFGIHHQRILRLTGDGEELQGRDILTGAAGRVFALRWHLHPAVQASLAQSGATALLRTSSGSGWRLRVENAELVLEPSIYCGSGTPRRSLQLKISGRTNGATTELIWSLSRERRA